MKSSHSIPIRSTLLLALFSLPLVARAIPQLEARGFVEATTVGNYIDNVNTAATGADTVTASLFLADSHIPGLSGESQFTASASFGAMSASGSASATGYTATSYFQAQPADRAYDFFTVYGSGPMNVTLHYQFDGSLTVPINQPGSVFASVQGEVYLAPSGRTDHSQEVGFNNFYTNGSGVVYPGFTYVPDASLGASQLFAGSATIVANPGDAFSLFGFLGIFGEAQNLNYDGRTVSLSTSGEMNYWISFDSPDAYLVSLSGADYSAPTEGGSSVPESTATVGLLGLGLGMLGLLAQHRRRRLTAAL